MLVFVQNFEGLRVQKKNLVISWNSIDSLTTYKI